jgi:hypothetical protein
MTKIKRGGRRGGTLYLYTPTTITPTITHEQACERFLDGANIEVLSHGTFGITFVATQYNPEKQYFKKLNQPNKDSPITKILLKICVIGERYQIQECTQECTIPTNSNIKCPLCKLKYRDDNPIFINNRCKHIFCLNCAKSKRYKYCPLHKVKYWNDDDNNDDDDNKLTIIPQYKFNNEINIQNDLVRKTVQYGDCLYPCIISSKIINNTNSDPIINYLSNVESNRNVKVDMKLFFLNFFYKQKQDNVSLGFVAMEFMEGYQTIFSQINQPSWWNPSSWNWNHIYDHDPFRRNTLKQALIIYALLETAIHGYNHNDFHGNNLLIKKITDESEMYFSGIYMNIILIDFGKAYPLENEVITEIKSKIDEKNYLEAFNILTKQNNSNDPTINYPKLSNYINDLYEARKTKIETIETIMRPPI